METLRWYLQQRKDNETIVFDHTVKKYGCPALFYAVARNSVEAIQILIQYGANPNDNDCPGIPLLAFAILYGKRKPTNITGVVKQLLAHGADPLVIPQDMWIDYIHDPKIACPTSPSKQAKWFNAEYRTGLVAALHLTQRYLLYRASRLKKLTDRELQLGSDHKIANLFRVPYFMIGQLPAAGLVMETVFSHVTNNNPVPLVMVFAGPSGHGKTELAEQMGDLLSVKHQVFNCSEWHSRIDILGGSNAYRRSEQGSILNNFVSENDGRRAVVVLDEFDKTTDEVRLSLLNVINRGMYTHPIPFPCKHGNKSYVANSQTGTFVDLRNNRKINSSKLIWIFATNFGDALIEGFYKRNVQHLSKEKQETVNLAPLQRDLMEAFRSTYGVSRQPTLIIFARASLPLD